MAGAGEYFWLRSIVYVTGLSGLFLKRFSWKAMAGFAVVSSS